MYKDFFEKIFCLHLTHRDDRLKQIIEDFKRVGLLEYVEFYNCDKDDSMGGNFGIYSLVKKAKELNVNNVLIFEDDADFFEEYNNKLDTCIEDIKKQDWELFYLGGTVFGEAKKITDNIAKLSRAYATQSICLNRNIFDILLDNKDIYMNHIPIDKYIDENIISRQKSYITIPLLVGQREGYSDCMNSNQNYNEMMKNYYNKMLK
jgi:GR25 family glycosyltransferase involved in LPS biosynthesis